MTPAFRYTLLWVCASALMVIAALSSISAAYVDGHYVPDNQDAFYHARRILDSVMTHAPVIQFDAKIHVPEGSWLTWPWGFDTLLARIVSVFGPYSSVDQANSVLMNIPPLAAPLAMLLVVLICRQLALPLLHSALFAFGFALLPTAFRAFSVGNVDHHFAELTWTLAMISAGLWFFRGGTRSPAAGITLGIVLGSAIAIQNGLFILQVPLCLVLALRWLRGDELPGRAQLCAFAAALFLTTVAVCIPSEPWRQGFFEFYTLSWFHFYISAVVAVFCVLLSTLARTRRTTLVMIVLAIAAIVPFMGVMVLAGEFVTGNLDTILNISEAKSPYRLLIERGEAESTMYMSFLMLLLLPMFLLNLWWVWSQRTAALQFIAVVGAFGLLLFLFQYRFNVFGLVPMLLTPLLAAKFLVESRPSLRKFVPLSAVALFVLAYLPTSGAWATTWALGSHLAYVNIRSTWPRFAELCKAQPGVALADLEAGHWIRYHTDCSVMSNVFLLTPQHAEKAAENARLLLLTPAQLLAARHDIRYVLVFHAVLIRNNPQGGEMPVLEALRLQLAPLERDLLGPAATIPQEFEKRWEVRSPQGQIYSRLYEIVRH